MISELITFTANLDEGFKNIGAKPKEGLHIMLEMKKSADEVWSLATENFRYERFSKKQKDEMSDFLGQCLALQQNAWMIDTNKCFDLPVKAIHTCSPFALGVKREHLKGGAKFIENEKKSKKQVYDRINEYFNKAFELFEDKSEKERYVIFKNIFSSGEFSRILDNIQADDEEKFIKIQHEIDNLKGQQKISEYTAEKESLKDKISDAEQRLLSVKPLEDSDYIIIYLNLPVEKYQEVHKKYLNEKLFNTDKYNTAENDQGLIFGTNNFMNGFNGNMPFLMHQTATFDITGRISHIDAKLLNDLKNLLPNKILPNPLPIFIFKDELQKKVISIFKQSDFKIGFREIIEKLASEDNEDIANYYLLFWQNSMDGIVFKDFDYVAKFQYEMKPALLVKNLFNLRETKEKGGGEKHYPIIKTIFDFEQQVFKPLIQNKFYRIDYFGDLSKEEYAKLDRTFTSFSKYRKAVYDFVYKSQRSAIDGHAFDEMAFHSILDDVKNQNDYGVKEKLNIWYSLHEFFNPKHKTDMVNKLTEYQDFVTALTDGVDVTEITDEKFAFAAGQVIDYILSKSKSADNSYNLLEPYLQQSKCSEFQKAIANDFGRYKHENFSGNFEKVAAFVLSYQTSANLKHLLPQILSGVFAKNQLFSSNNQNKNNNGDNI